MQQKSSNQLSNERVREKQIADNSRAARKKSTINQYDTCLLRYMPYWFIVLFLLAALLMSAICFSLTYSLLRWLNDFCFMLLSAI